MPDTSIVFNTLQQPSARSFPHLDGLWKALKSSLPKYIDITTYSDATVHPPDENPAWTATEYTTRLRDSKVPCLLNEQANRPVPHFGRSTALRKPYAQLDP